MEQATEAEAEADLGDGSTIPFGTTRYWDQRYLKDKEPFDWYARYDGLEAVLAAHAEDKDVEVLHVGCGTSTLGEDLCGAGFKYVMNLDISRACIIAQLERYEQLRNNKFMHGNACALEFPDETFDLVIAKATLDVIRCGEGALGNVRRCCGEVVRVLRPGGRFIAVSHAADLGERIDSGLTATKLEVGKLGKKVMEDHAMLDEKFSEASSKMDKKFTEKMSDMAMQIEGDIKRCSDESVRLSAKFAKRSDEADEKFSAMIAARGGRAARGGDGEGRGARGARRGDRQQARLAERAAHGHVHEARRQVRQEEPGDRLQD